MTAPTVGTMWATWTDPAGNEIPLSDIAPDRGHFTTKGVAGWGAVPFEYTLDVLPRGGSEVRHIRQEPARITWPLHIYGETHLEFKARYRAVRRAFLMTAHRRLPGLLRCALPDSSVREIEAFYEDGFRGEPGENWLYANPVLTLLCPDGFWRDTAPTTVRREFSPGTSFLSPFPTISSSQVLGDTEVDNVGDTVAWPVWTIDGPMTALTATSATTGQSFTLTTTLLAGEQVVITTQRPAVRGPADINLVGDLNWPTAYLWGLEPGVNEITFTVAGSGAGTAIELTFHPRYEGA